jgi:ion channel POLLUX/CASTOR
MPSPLGIRALLRRAVNRTRFELGQFLSRGAFHRITLIAALIGLVSAVGGIAEWYFDDSIPRLNEAIWWSFLRLTDPGYLGDDQGITKRFISTLLTVAGYVLFLGALIAIMTQWLNQNLRRMESGLTPIARDGHVLVAGWTDRTVSILREMFRTEDRSHSLLGGRGGSLTVVVLAEHAGPELREELRERMGEHFSESQVILRQGEALRLDHLRRADFAHAAAIVLPADPYLSGEHAPSDVRVMKTLLSVARHARRELGNRPLPVVVAELFDSRREQVAKDLYPGRIEVVVSDRLIGRMLALNLRHPGLTHVYRELLFERSGQGLKVVPVPEGCVGLSFRELVQRLPRTVVLGVSRAGSPTLCPPPFMKLEKDDHLVTFSRESAEVEEGPDEEAERMSLVPSPRPRNGSTLKSLLVLGWTRKVPAVLEELTCTTGEPLHVDVISTSEFAERSEELGALAADPKLLLHHERADYTLPTVLASRDLSRYDAVLLVGSDRLESGAESDARSIVGYEVLVSCLPRSGAIPRVVIEMTDTDNAALLEEQDVEVLVSPQLLGRVLSQVALVPELCEVYDELFGAGGAELAIHPAAEYGIAGGGAIHFGALREAVTRVGHVLLGALTADGRAVSLNPPPETPFFPASEVRVVVAVRES